MKVENFLHFLQEKDELGSNSSELIFKMTEDDAERPSSLQLEECLNKGTTKDSSSSSSDCSSSNGLEIYRWREEVIPHIVSLTRVASAVSFLIYYSLMPNCCGISPLITEYVLVCSLMLLLSLAIPLCKLKWANSNMLSGLFAMHNLTSVINLMWAASYGNSSVVGLVFGLVGCLCGFQGNMKRYKRSTDIISSSNPESGQCGALLRKCCSCATVLVVINNMVDFVELLLTLICFPTIGEDVTFPAYSKSDDSHHFYSMDDQLECSLYLNYTTTSVAFDGNEVEELCVQSYLSEFTECCVWHR